MKNRNAILIPLIIFNALLFNSCNFGSVKGKWSEFDKKRFFKEMERTDLSSLGELKTKWIDCFFNKAEANYSSFIEADNDIKGCKKLGMECNKEVLSNGSVKGKWSESDKKKFFEEIERADLSDLGENKTKWIECYFNKAEANYSSFIEANNDQTGCEKLVLKCNEEITN